MYYRIPHAATQLIEQVTAERKSAKYEREGEPDGLEVIRTISFDKGTSTWLKPILEAVEDERIQEMHLLKDRLHVTFTAGPEADSREEFPLADADEVLSQ